METEHITYYPSRQLPNNSIDLEDDYYNSLLCYSFRHLTFINNVSEVDNMNALQKALQICNMAGIECTHHFKQIYVYDANENALYTDWLMSKKGFNLMVMQIPVLNKQSAIWLWQLANL